LSDILDWKQYEREITDQFRETYPKARITPDAKLPGKFSKVERQIDLLIEEQASDFSFRIIVDAKRRGRKIDDGGLAHPFRKPIRTTELSLAVTHPLAKSARRVGHPQCNL
jgi:hypothetical protein